MYGWSVWFCINCVHLLVYQGGLSPCMEWILNSRHQTNYNLNHGRRVLPSLYVTESTVRSTASWEKWWHNQISQVLRDVMRSPRVSRYFQTSVQYSSYHMEGSWGNSWNRRNIVMCHKAVSVNWNNVHSHWNYKCAPKGVSKRSIKPLGYSEASLAATILCWWQPSTALVDSDSKLMQRYYVTFQKT